MSTIDWILIALQGLVVIGFIALGVRRRIGLGLWGGVGTLVLVFGFGLAPGEPPISAMLIIVAVISASAAMQARRDRLHGPDRQQGATRPSESAQLRRAVRLLAAHDPDRDGQHLLLPDPGDQRARLREQDQARAGARGSAVASTFGITASPVAAAMATMLPLVEIYGYDIVDVMLITIPASIVGIFAMALVMNPHGKDLDDDQEYQRRLAADEIKPPAPACEITLLPYAKRSVAIFLTAVAAICVFGVVEGLRPTVPAEGGGVEPMSVTPMIQMFMLTAAALIRPGPREGERHPQRQIFMSGMVSMIALFGIAWMADTFIANNEDAIVTALGGLAENLALHDRGGHLPRRRPNAESTGLDADDGPARPRTRDRRRLHDRVWTAVAGVLCFPANGTQIAAAEADKTGTTTLGKRVIDHSFQFPLQIAGWPPRSSAA